jgi:hypothetical protein
MVYQPRPPPPSQATSVTEQVRGIPKVEPQRQRFALMSDDQNEAKKKSLKAPLFDSSLFELFSRGFEDEETKGKQGKSGRASSPIVGAPVSQIWHGPIDGLAGVMGFSSGLSRESGAQGNQSSQTGHGGQFGKVGGSIVPSVALGSETQISQTDQEGQAVPPQSLNDPPQMVQGPESEKPAENRSVLEKESGRQPNRARSPPSTLVTFFFPDLPQKIVFVD